VYVNPKEALMNSARRIFAALAVVLALCVAPAANAEVDYSMNAAGGDYAPAATSTTAAPATSTEPDFSWGSAAVGAGVALVLVLVATGARGGLSTLRSRRQAA
jgi:hypothetical protein